MAGAYHHHGYDPVEDGEQADVEPQLQLRQGSLSMTSSSTAHHGGDTPRSNRDTGTILTADRTPFRAEGFAEKQALAGWFPRVNDDEKTSWKIRLTKRDKALLIQICLVAIIFVTNLVILLHFSSRYPSRKGVGVLYAGDCDTVKTANRYAHLLINVLSTGMLSASNFCIQLQASPTRGDIDRAHKRNRWLDIGVPSLRNLRYIGRQRLASCIVLSLSSLPIHLIFNSAVFQTLASNDYMVAVVKDSFLSGASWSLSTAERNWQDDPGWDDREVTPPEESYQSIMTGIQKDVVAGLYEAKNTSDCYAIYDDYWTVQGNVVVLIKNETETKTVTATAGGVGDDSLLLYTFVAPRYTNWAKNMWAAGNGTKRSVAFSPPPPVTTWFLGVPRYEASSCLVQVPQASADRCRLQYSIHILVAVCILNFFKLVALFFVWHSRKTDDRRRKAKREEWGAVVDVEEHMLAPKELSLSTLGDAIASFMREPDETTRDMCLATKHDSIGTKRLLKRQGRGEKDTHVHPRKWNMSPRRWMTAASWRQWLCVVALYTLFIGILYTCFGLLVTSGLKGRHYTLTLSFFKSLGFGTVTPRTYLSVSLPRGDPLGLIMNVLLVNSPQLFFSIIYSVSGAVVTTMLVQREFSVRHASAHRKPLRVSEPVGIQRSSYFISLPFRYGVPLNVSSAAFHWLISQSFFLARIAALLPDGSEDYGNSFSTLGYSPLAIIISIAGFVNLVAIVLVGCREYDGTMSMVSTNSMAISAACHGHVEDREFGYQLPIQWGVVEIGEDGIGHCAFTTAPCHVVRKPQEGMMYQ